MERSKRAEELMKSIETKSKEAIVLTPRGLVAAGAKACKEVSFELRQDDPMMGLMAGMLGAQVMAALTHILFDKDPQPATEAPVENKENPPA